jgi:hypothetical protein
MFGQLGISRQGDHCVGVGEVGGLGKKWIESPHNEEEIFEVRYLGSNMLPKYRSSPTGQMFLLVFITCNQFWLSPLVDDH